MDCKENNKCSLCDRVKTLSIFTLIFLIIALVIYITINNPIANKNILVAIATNNDNTGKGNVIINFGTNEIAEGSAISHAPGSSEILINENGIYQISYSLNGVDQGSGRFNFNSILLVNNVSINSTLNEGPVLSEDIVNNRYTLTATVILRLNNGDILQLGGLSLEDVVYPNARIDIEKIG